MKYEVFRENIKSGDVLAWTHKGIKSWTDFEVFVVRLMQRSEYSHVGVAWVFGGRVFILEAVGSGIRIMPLSKEVPCFHLDTKVEWTPEVEEYALSKIGEKYSKWEAIRGFFGKAKDDNKWQCAEYTKKILSKAGIDLDCRATPSGVVDALLSENSSLVKLDV